MTEKQHRVLIVDDQPLMLELASKAFQKKGYSIITAGSGESALEVLNNEHPDIALVDIVMPGMDGMELLSAIKNSERTEDIPVYMFSSYSYEGHVIESEQQGASGFISKQGLSIKSLLQRIDEISALLSA